MPLSPFDLAGARDAVEKLLAQLNLKTFLFEVEHTERGWELRVECATEDGWQAQTILLGAKLPAASKADLHLRADSWHCWRRGWLRARGAGNRSA